MKTVSCLGEMGIHSSMRCLSRYPFTTRTAISYFFGCFGNVARYMETCGCNEAENWLPSTTSLEQPKRSTVHSGTRNVFKVVPCLLTAKTPVGTGFCCWLTCFVDLLVGFQVAGMPTYHNNQLCNQMVNHSSPLTVIDHH